MGRPISNNNSNCWKLLIKVTSNFKRQSAAKATERVECSTTKSFVFYDEIYRL